MYAIMESRLGRAWALVALLAALLSTGCKEDPSVEPVIEPPIDLCMEYGLGNMDERNMESTSFTFVNNPNAPVDYVVNCFSWVLIDVTIEPGTVIEFGQDAGFLVKGDGSLASVGNVSDTIVFRGTNETPGWWRGIAFGEDDLQNKLVYTIIDGAGGKNTVQGGPFTALFDNTRTLTIEHTTISNSKSDGYVVAGIGKLESFANNTFLNNAGFPLTIHAENFWKLDGTGSTYKGNVSNMIRMNITPGSVLTLNTDQTWKNPGVPVLLDEGTLGIRADLKIEAGFEMVLQPECHISISDKGSLNAVGTAEQPIVFRGEQDVQGYWEGMYWTGSNVLNRMEYVTVSNGGNSKPFGAAPAMANLYLSTDTDNVSISNSTFSQSGGCGIFAGGSEATLTNITYSNNKDGDLCE